MMETCLMHENAGECSMHVWVEPAFCSAVMFSMHLLQNIVQLVCIVSIKSSLSLLSIFFLIDKNKIDAAMIRKLLNDITANMWSHPGCAQLWQGHWTHSWAIVLREMTLFSSSSQKAQFTNPSKWKPKAECPYIHPTRAMFYLIQICPLDLDSNDLGGTQHPPG